MAEKKASVAELAGLFIRKAGFREVDGAERQVLRYWRGDFYFWQGGMYHKASPDEIKSLMVRVLAAEGEIATVGLLDNLKLHVVAGTLLGEGRVPDTWISDTDSTGKPVDGIVLDNGILVEKDGGRVLIPLTPDFFCLGKLPYRYDPEALCERWLRYLDEVTRGDKGLQRLLRQWAGYLLMTSHRYQSFLLLIGEAGTGKGTFARAMKAMLGVENCSDIPLRRFTDKFSLYLTYGKKLNVVGDAEQELTPQAEAVIKTWTGEDGLDYEKKYGAGFTAQPTAKLMVLANDMPTFTDKSMGTWRRLKIVPFYREDPTHVEKGLDETLRGELPGILNWALEGMQDLEGEGGFTVSEVSKRLLEMHREESNPARMFLKENYQYDPEYQFGVSKQSLYEGYVLWCNANGYQKMSNKTFGKEVRREFPQVEERRLGGHTSDTRYKIHKGLKVYPGAEVLRLFNRKK